MYQIFTSSLYITITVRVIFINLALLVICIHFNSWPTYFIQKASQATLVYWQWAIRLAIKFSHSITQTQEKMCWLMSLLLFSHFHLASLRLKSVLLSTCGKDFYSHSIACYWISYINAHLKWFILLLWSYGGLWEDTVSLIAHIALRAFSNLGGDWSTWRLPYPKKKKKGWRSRLGIHEFNSLFWVGWVTQTL